MKSFKEAVTWIDYRIRRWVRDDMRKRRVLSPAQLFLFALIAVLAVGAEVLIYRAYLNESNSYNTSTAATASATNLVSIQRAADSLEIESLRALDEGTQNFNVIAATRQLLDRNLAKHLSLTAGNETAAVMLGGIQASLAQYDESLRSYRDAGSEIGVAGRAAFGEKVRTGLTEIRARVNAFTEFQESGFLGDANGTLRNQQVLMLIVSALVVILCAVLVVSLRRPVRDLRIAIAKRDEAQMSEGLRRRELEALFSIANTLVRPGLFQEKSEVVLDEIAHIAAADLVTLRVLDEKGKELHLLAQAGPATWRQSASVSSESTSWAVLQSGALSVINDYQSHPKANLPDIEHGIRSLVSLPISAGVRKPFGVVNVMSMEADHFDPDLVKVLGAIGNGLGALLDQAQMSTAYETSLDELAKLEEFAGEITSSLELPEIYKRFGSGITKLLHVDRAYVALMDEVTGDCTMELVLGRPQSGSNRRLSLLPLDPIQDVIDTGHTWVRGNLKVGLRQSCDDDHLAMGLKSSIAVPLMYDGSAIGALELLSRQEEGFGKKEQAVLHRVARHLAIAIEHARRVQELYAQIPEQVPSVVQLLREA